MTCHQTLNLGYNTDKSNVFLDFVANQSEMVGEVRAEVYRRGFLGPGLEFSAATAV